MIISSQILLLNYYRKFNNLAVVVRAGSCVGITCPPRIWRLTFSKSAGNETDCPLLSTIAP